MASQSYYKNNNNSNNQNSSHYNDQQPQQDPGHQGYPSPYGHSQTQPSHHSFQYGQDNEPMNWGYGSGNQAPQSQQQSYDQYSAHSQVSYNSQQYSSHDHSHAYQQHYESGQSYSDHPPPASPYHNQNDYDTGAHVQQQHTSQHGSHSTDYNRQAFQDPYSTSQYPDQGFASQNTTPAYPGGHNQPDGERGLLGAIGGAAAGGYAGHKVNHGFIGAVGGAYAGHKLEDHLKDKKKKDKKEKKDKYGHGRCNSSSSSSSSSDDDKKKKKKYGTAAGVAAGGGAAAYVYGQGKQKHDQPQAMAGNFSASCTQISLDRDYDLIASCGTVAGGHKLSSISLNGCLTNSWGQLQWARGGGFGGSSRNVRLVDGGRVLEAELGDGRGGWNVSRIRLDERITNNDGDLQFLG